jgi:hypothetical protein
MLELPDTDLSQRVRPIRDSSQSLRLLHAVINWRIFPSELVLAVLKSKTHLQANAPELIRAANNKVVAYD